VILAGSSAQVEIDLAAQVMKATQANLVNLVGQSSLKKMLALLKESKLVIAPDTGPYLYRDYVVSAYQQAIEAETGKVLSDVSWRARVKDSQAMLRIKAVDVKNLVDKACIDFSLYPID
jgi:heptosyltransferase I